MNYKEKVISLWDDMDKQNWNNISTYFDKNAVINWHNTNESFNVNEFIMANREYPGDWKIEIERLECIKNLVISVVKIQLQNDNNISFHASSFFEFNDNKIKLLNEYWGNDEKAPQWRIDKKIGKKIKNE